MYDAKILADSISEDGARLTTMEVTFPRFILAEFNTHRVFSRNSASSRAIPLKKQIDRLIDDPFVPEKWPGEQKGMVGTDGLTEQWMEQHAVDAWIGARSKAIEMAERMASLGVHKSIANRLLEPFMWHTCIVSSTDWCNFFELRTSKNAQPEFRKVALMMRDLYKEGKPRLVLPDEWHLPLTDDFDAEWKFLCKISTARCARISYLTHDGKRDVTKDIELHDRLKKDKHMSPFEHIATPLLNKRERCKNFHGWRQYRDIIENDSDRAALLPLGV